MFIHSPPSTFNSILNHYLYGHNICTAHQVVGPIRVLYPRLVEEWFSQSRDRTISTVIQLLFKLVFRIPAKWSWSTFSYCRTFIYLFYFTRLRKLNIYTIYHFSPTVHQLDFYGISLLQV